VLGIKSFSFSNSDSSENCHLNQPLKGPTNIIKTLAILFVAHSRSTNIAQKYKRAHERERERERDALREGDILNLQQSEKYI